VALAYQTGKFRTEQEVATELGISQQKVNASKCKVRKELARLISAHQLAMAAKVVEQK
jgi:hypothetical protein